tara:strand:+ start:11 stop:700 length:690 start_codon:yes stop_codon:yes gene_type:complete
VGLLGKQHSILDGWIIQLAITAILLLAVAWGFTVDELRWISLVILFIFSFNPLVVHDMLSMRRKNIEEEGKPSRLFPDLDIPAPILEENKDEYLAELDEISAAEQWVEEHSVAREISHRDHQKIPHDSALVNPNKKQSKRRILTSSIIFAVILVISALLLSSEVFAILCLGALVLSFLRVGNSKYVGDKSYLEAFYVIIAAIILAVIILSALAILFVDMMSNPGDYFTP